MDIFGLKSIQNDQITSLITTYKDLKGNDDILPSYNSLPQDFTERVERHLTGMIHVLKARLKNDSVIIEKPNNKPWFSYDGKTYKISPTLFWTVVFPLAAAIYNLGNIKFDADKIRLSDENKDLRLAVQRLKQRIEKDSVRYSQIKKP